jgi:hypothetical protein
MREYLSTSEEFDIIRNLQFPQTFVLPKASLSLEILKREPETLLLISPYGFSSTSILAGFSLKHIEFIAKNAPTEYKMNILECLMNPGNIQEIFSIAKEMDDDQGNKEQQNQLRIQNVIQYVKDNLPVFQF